MPSRIALVDSSVERASSVSSMRKHELSAVVAGE